MCKIWKFSSNFVNTSTIFLHTLYDWLLPKLYTEALWFPATRRHNFFLWTKNCTQLVTTQAKVVVLHLIQTFEDHEIWFYLRDIQKIKYEQLVCFGEEYADISCRIHAWNQWLGGEAKVIFKTFKVIQIHQIPMLIAFDVVGDHLKMTVTVYL